MLVEMKRKQPLTYAVVLLLSIQTLLSVNAFTPSHVISGATRKSSPATSINVLPPETVAAATESVVEHVASSTSSSLMLGMSDDIAGLIKYFIIVAAFGGGLIPAALAGNKAMFETLAGKRRGGEQDIDAADYNPKTNMDPTVLDTKLRAYVESSGGTGAELSGSALLFPNERIPLVDIIAIMGRIQNVDSLCDWKNLPSAKLPNVSPTNPPTWLPRAAFKVNMRKAKFTSWPVDPSTGEPVGGSELKAVEEKRIKQSGALIGDAALDAVWDSWAWGASITTPDKVGAALREYRSTGDTFQLNNFVSAAVRGRSITGIAALSFIVIQVIAYGTLFIAPALRQYANIDIGFGELGYCNPEACLHVFAPK